MEVNLRQLYLNENLTSREIGNIFSVSHRTILNWLIKYNISRRPQWGIAEVPYWKGKSLSIEHRNKISETRKLRKIGQKYNSPTWGGGEEITCFYCEKLQWVTPYELKIKKHIFCSRLCKANWQSENLRGKYSSNWRGGIDTTHNLERKSREYKQWAKDVKKRDRYTCQHCGIKGVSLHADHIKPFAFYSELRLNLENGRTLCIDCHKKTDTWGAKRKEGYYYSL